MPPRQRLFWQISLPMVLVMMAAMAGATWYAADALRTFFLAQTRTDLEIRAELVAKQITPFFAAEDHARLNDLCRRIGEESATRLTVIDSSGRVLADSMENPARMDNHADRFEVIDGLAGRIGTSIRFSHTVQQNMLYLALPLPNTDGGKAGVLRLSIPVTALDRTLDTVLAKIIASAILLVLIASLITLSVSRRITRPLEEMRANAERFADGDLDRAITLADTGHASTEMADLAEAMNRMAAQLNDRIRTITEQRNELEAVFSSMVEAVLVVDNHERIISLNRAAGQLLAISVDAARGKPVLEVLRNPDLVRFVRRTLDAAGKRQEEEIVLRDEGGDTFFQAYGTLLRDSAGHGLGALIVLNDVTRLRRLENVRRDFVANVSHELRTPITAIKGFVETLRDGAASCPKDAERFLAIILKHADRLNAIVDDLLTLSRIEQEGEAGEVLLEPGSVARVLHNAIETCLTQAQAKNITLALTCPEGLTARLNEPLLEQAVINLVVNSIKYSPENSAVRVTGTAMAGTVRITVRDCGVGISREHLPRLFERFYRSDKARSRNLGGTGLGLAIVKHIVQAHDGTVRVESRPGKGTTFTIDLPA